MFYVVNTPTTLANTFTSVFHLVNMMAVSAVNTSVFVLDVQLTLLFHSATTPISVFYVVTTPTSVFYVVTTPTSVFYVVTTPISVFYVVTTPTSVFCVVTTLVSVFYIQL